VPYYGDPTPALNSPCHVANWDGYISSTVGYSGSNANAQCTIAGVPSFTQGTPSFGQSVPYYGIPVPALGSPCTVGGERGFISRTSGNSAANTGCLLKSNNGPTIVAWYEATPALPSLGIPIGSLYADTDDLAETLFASLTGNLGLNDYFWIGNEEMQVSGVQKTDPVTLSVLRHVNGTRAAHRNGDPLHLATPCTVAGFRGTVAASNPSWSPGSKPFDLVWVTDSDGTGLQRSGTDRNGYPLNPLWFSQISDPTNLNNTLNFAATCGLPAPVTPQSFLAAVQSDLAACTTQHPRLDTFAANTSTGSIEEGMFGVCSQDDTSFPGHVNFYLATYTGAIYWDDWSDGSCDPSDLSITSSGVSAGPGFLACGADHDYNLSLFHGDYSGLTASFADEDYAAIGLDPNTVPGPGAAAIHLEFNSDESIDSFFGSPFWQHFRGLVEGGSGNSVLSGNEAVVTGQLGIDAVHKGINEKQRGGYTELHPVFSLAFHDSPLDPDQEGHDSQGRLTIEQHWHFFIRNRGTEGTCSRLVYTWVPFRGGTDYYMQLPWPMDPDGVPAISVKWVDSASRYWAWMSGMAQPSYEIVDGKWLYIHFNLPILPLTSFPKLWFASGFDGDIALQVTYAKGKYDPREKRKPLAQQHAVNLTHDTEVEVVWAKALPRLTDPAVKIRLQRAMVPRKSTPPAQGKGLAFTARTSTQPTSGQGTALLPKSTTDPVRARHMDDLAAALGFAPVTFQQPPATQSVFVLDVDGTLWLEDPPFGQVPPRRHQVDTNVRTFQSLGEHRVFVLGNDGTLSLDQGTFGTLAATKQQIDRNLVNFQALDSQNIIVLGSDAKLWLEGTPFGTVPPARSLVDVNIRGFQAFDAQNVLVVDHEDNLWLDQAPFGALPPTRQQLDANVWSFYSPQLNGSIFVLDGNGSLWLEQPPFGNIPPLRQQIDESVDSFQALNNTSAVWALREDGNLWLEQAPFPPSGASRQQIGTSVRAFQPLDVNHALVLLTDGNLWLEQAPFGRTPPTRVHVDALASQEPASTAMPQLPTFAGTWELVSMTMNGVAQMVTHQTRIGITQNGQLVRIGNDEGSRLTSEGTITYKKLFVHDAQYGHKVDTEDQADLVDTLTWRLEGSNLIVETIYDYRRPYGGHPIGKDVEISEFHRVLQ
jgi:hypothetical protein